MKTVNKFLVILLFSLSINCYSINQNFQQILSHKNSKFVAAIALSALAYKKPHIIKNSIVLGTKLTAFTIFFAATGLLAPMLIQEDPIDGKSSYDNFIDLLGLNKSKTWKVWEK